MQLNYRERLSRPTAPHPRHSPWHAPESPKIDRFKPEGLTPRGLARLEWITATWLTQPWPQTRASHRAADFWVLFIVCVYVYACVLKGILQTWHCMCMLHVERHSLCVHALRDLQDVLKMVLWQCDIEWHSHLDWSLLFVHRTHCTRHSLCNSCNSMYNTRSTINTTEWVRLAL